MQEAFIRTMLDEVPARRSHRSKIGVRQLRESATAVRRLRRRCDYDAAALLLPAAITDAHRLANDGSRAALKLLGHLCFDASFTARARADGPTASIAADRAARAAYLAGDPVLLAGAGFAQAHAALRSDAADRSLRISRECLAVLPDRGADVAALRGMLALTEALARSRTWTPRWPVVQADLVAAEAELPAARGARDRFDLMFSATNVRLWTLTIAMALGELAPARRVAGDISPAAPALTKPSRRCALLLNLARLAARTGPPDRAVAFLHQADQVAPQYLWSRTAAHELTDTLLRSRLPATTRADLRGLRSRRRPTYR